MWLCGLPEGPASSEAEMEDEGKRLEDEQKGIMQREFDSLKKAQRESGSDARYRQEYEEKTKRLARRKHNRYGVATECNVSFMTKFSDYQINKRSDFSFKITTTRNQGIVINNRLSSTTLYVLLQSMHKPHKILTKYVFVFHV